MNKTIQMAILSLLVKLPLCLGQTAAMNGVITGAITDPSGAAVSGAIVKATNTSTGLTQSARSEDSGLYRLSLLPIGAYDLEVAATGFATERRVGVQVNAGSTVTVNVPLRVAGSTTQVDVTAGVSITDPSRADLGSTLDNNTTRNLPLVSRNPYNFILFQPNVSGRANTEFGVPRRINANGFNGRINYEIDGSDNTESDRAGIRLIPISNTYVEEVQQVSNGFAPEFGNTVGTVFNTITKSGTNEYHGEGAYIFRRTPFSAGPKLLPASAPTPDVNVDSYSADGGGPVVREKLFFFGAFEHVNRDLPMPVTVPAAIIAQLGLPASYANAIPFSQSVYFYMAKADWMINSRNRLSVRYMHHANDSPYNNTSTIGGQFLVSQSYNFIDRSHVGGLQLVSTISPNAINELRGQAAYRGQSNDKFSATGTGPAITIFGVANFGGPTGVGFVYNETIPEVADNFSYNFNTHALKFGASSRWIRDTQVQATTAIYTFPSISSYLAAASGTNPRSYINFVQTLGNPSLDYNSAFAGFFAQDSWKPLRNLTLIYGLRYDLYKVPDANKTSPFRYSQSFRTDKNNVGPRLGMAYGFGRNQNTVVRASMGIFYDPPQTDQYRRAILNNGSANFLNISATPASPYALAFPNVLTSVPTGFSVPPGDITTISPDFATLSSYNANISVSQQISATFVVSASFLYTSGNRLPIYRNINLVPNGQFLVDGRPVFSATDRVYPGFANIISAESVGHSTYNGLNLTAQKHLARGYEFYATYTWSHAIDDAPEQNNIDSGNTVTLSDPTNRRRDRGNSLTDKRHVFNMTGIWMPEVHAHSRVMNYLLNLNRISIGLVASSGDLFNIGSNRILNGDSSASAAYERPLFVGRNTVRAPAVFELNARYSRLFPLTEKKSLEFLAESTNITNTLNVTNLNTTAQVDPLGNILIPSPNAATAARDQRLIQLGLRFNF
ncbi:MAG: TonB-dependent receptor [Bryobacteraceae bacterium]